MKRFICDGVTVIVTATGVEVSVSPTLPTEDASGDRIPSGTRVARCPSLHLCGQGYGEEGARASLADVVHTYLTVYHDAGRLTEALTGPSWVPVSA